MEFYHVHAHAAYAMGMVYHDLQFIPSNLVSINYDMSIYMGNGKRCCELSTPRRAGYLEL